MMMMLMMTMPVAVGNNLIILLVHVRDVKFGTTIGLAYVARMCNYDLSCAFTTVSIVITLVRF